MLDSLQLGLAAGLLVLAFFKFQDAQDERRKKM